eukprot:462260-Pyramimonas_sp.AAC.1
MPSYSCYTSRSGDGEQIHIDEENVDLVLFVNEYDATTLLGLPKLRRFIATRFAIRRHLGEQKVEFGVLFPVRTAGVLSAV